MTFRWTEADGPLVDGLVEEWTEVDGDGQVVRVVGFDAAGRVAFKWPDPNKKDDYGPWDMALVDVSSDRDRVDPVEFERAWTTLDGEV